MTVAARPTILMPLTLGSMELAHRAVMLARNGLSVQDLSRLATPGGLLIPAAAAPGADWAGVAAGLRRGGTYLVAALPAGDAIAAAEAAMNGGCDGVEFDVAALAPARLLKGWRRRSSARGRRGWAYAWDAQERQLIWMPQSICWLR